MDNIVSKVFNLAIAGFLAGVSLLVSEGLVLGPIGAGRMSGSMVEQVGLALERVGYG